MLVVLLAACLALKYMLLHSFVGSFHPFLEGVMGKPISYPDIAQMHHLLELILMPLLIKQDETIFVKEVTGGVAGSRM
ncbi:hypothetical protein NDU88_000084 [Pleurodeles waltl]|uniref:Uncharacterized protein n=1 Tax=Pleurodeles waltl TaxID=8319 RepID=A0AAV7UNZ4_PLEWA|nr:hypothetical protein NDU88_000084 [Pleurodeles waltl]